MDRSPHTGLSWALEPSAGIRSSCRAQRTRWRASLPSIRRRPSWPIAHLVACATCSIRCYRSRTAPWKNGSVRALSPPVARADPPPNPSPGPPGTRARGTTPTSARPSNHARRPGDVRAAPQQPKVGACSCSRRAEDHYAAIRPALGLPVPRSAGRRDRAHRRVDTGGGKQWQVSPSTVTV